MRIDPAIVSLLEEAEVDYVLKPGTKHIKLVIGGRMVAVLPRHITSSSVEKGKNVLLAIRRHLRRIGRCP